MDKADKKAFYLLLLVSVFLLSFLILSCEKKKSTVSPENRLIEDVSGLSIKLDKRPQRIISVSLMTDEYLLALADEDQILGLSRLADDPRYSNVRDKAKKLTSRFALNSEQLISARPDLVLAASWADPQKISHLREMGMQVFLVKAALNLEDIKSAIKKIGRLCGNPEKTRDLQQWVSQTELSLRQTREELADGKPLLLDYNSWNAASGKGTSWDSICNLAGAENAAAPYASDKFGQVPLSEELLLQIKLDFLVVSYFDQKDRENKEREIKSSLFLSNLTAVKNGDIIYLKEALKSSTSYFLLEAALKLAKILENQKK